MGISRNERHTFEICMSSWIITFLNSREIYIYNKLHISILLNKWKLCSIFKIFQRNFVIVSQFLIVTQPSLPECFTLFYHCLFRYKNSRNITFRNFFNRDLHYWSFKLLKRWDDEVSKALMLLSSYCTVCFSNYKIDKLNKNNLWHRLLHVPGTGLIPVTENLN